MSGRIFFTGLIWGVAFVGVAVCSSSLAGAQPAPASSAPSVSESSSPSATAYTLRDGSLIYRDAAGTEHGVVLPCEGRLLYVSESRVYVACGARGVVTVGHDGEALPSVLSARDMDAEVSGFFSAQGQVWVQLRRVEARPLAAGTGDVRFTAEASQSPASSASAAPAADENPAVGEVIELRSDQVVVNLGTEAGLKVEDSIKLFSLTDADLGGAGGVSERQLSVGTVTAVGSERARVRLGVNEEVDLGTLARVTRAATTDKIIARPRVGGLWEVGGMLRPFLAIGNLGFGAVASVDVNYRFESPLRLGVLFDPIGFGLADEGDVLALVGNATVSYDSQLFEIGLGLGYSTVDGDLETEFLEVEAASGGEDEEPKARAKAGFSVAQVARLGAQEGLHLTIFNSFILFEDLFRYGGTNATIQIPLVRTMWLLLRGGGGNAGYAYGELGLRILVKGNGGAGSLFLIPSIGGASVTGEFGDCDDWYGDCNTETYGGPMVGFGAQWRLP